MTSGIERVSAVHDQINSFKQLVDEINTIPNIKIDLQAKTDRQRDSLAFVVDELYRQFKDTNWQDAVRRFSLNVTSERDTAKATRKLLQFVGHLYTSRVIAIKADALIPEEEKRAIEQIYQLYSHTIQSILKQSPENRPVSFAGVHESFLPDWYRQRLYLK